MTAITDAGLNVGDNATVKGLVRFGSLTKKSDPSYNKNGKDVYYLTLANPEIVSSNNKEAMAKYIQLKEFTSHAAGTGPKGETRINFQNGSPFAPRIFDTVVKNPEGEESNKFLKGELAKGQEVTVQIQVFQPKGQPNAGVGLNAVLIKDANNVQYANSNVTISAFGLKGNPDAVKPEENPVDAPTEDAPAAGNTSTVSDNPFAKKDGSSDKKDYSDPFHPES